MIEYVGQGTIFAAQLDYAGFKAEPDKWWCCDGDEWTLQDEGAEKWQICAARHPTYRSDTLLAWLLEYAENRVNIWQGTNSCHADYYRKGVLAVSNATAETLPDALAGIILEVLNYPRRHVEGLP